MTSVLLSLYLRSRRVGWIALLVVASAVLRRILAPWSTGSGEFDTLVSLLFVAAPASVIAAGLASPFGEAERSAGHLLGRLRSTQLAGTALVAGAGFAVAATTSGVPIGEYPRDFAGFLGIALLTGVVLGAQRCWTLPLGYAVLCAGEVDLGQRPLWAWPVLPAGNLTATVVAGALLVLGAGAAIVVGLPDR